MASTVYAYAVTINCQGENHIERVNAYNVMDAFQAAVLQFCSSRNITGKSSEGATVMRVEPDYTIARRPSPDADIADQINLSGRRETGKIVPPR